MLGMSIPYSWRWEVRGFADIYKTEIVAQAKFNDADNATSQIDWKLREYIMQSRPV